MLGASFAIAGPPREPYLTQAGGRDIGSVATTLATPFMRRFTTPGERRGSRRGSSRTRDTRYSQHPRRSRRRSAHTNSGCRARVDPVRCAGRVCVWILWRDAISDSALFRHPDVERWRRTTAASSRTVDLILLMCSRPAPVGSRSSVALVVLCNVRSHRAIGECAVESLATHDRPDIELLAPREPANAVVAGDGSCSDACPLHRGLNRNHEVICRHHGRRRRERKLEMDAVEPDDRVEMHDPATLELGNLGELKTYDTGSCALRQSE